MIRTDIVLCNIIIVLSRRMLLAPPKKNINHSPFEKPEAQAFSAFPMRPNTPGSSLKPSNNFFRIPTDLEVPPVWRAGAVKQKRLNACGRKLDSDRTFPSDDLRISSGFTREWRRSMSIQQTVSICFKAEASNRVRTPFPHRQRIEIAIPTFQEIEAEAPLYAKLNDFRPKFLQSHIIEKQKQYLLKANEELLNEMDEARNELFIKQKTIQDLRAQLGEVQTLNAELRTKIWQEGEQKKHKSDLYTGQLRQNERLVREVNELKAKIKQNMKNLRLLRFSKESSTELSEGILEVLME